MDPVLQRVFTQSINDDIINNLPQLDIINETLALPTLEGIQKTIKDINTRKVPDLDGIPIEALLHGGTKLAQEILHFIINIWQGASIHQDWVDEILISLYKGKG